MRNSMNLHHTRTKIIIACILVAALAALSLIVGKYPLTVKELIAGDTMQHRVLFNLRIPRTVMALMGGTGLGLSIVKHGAILHGAKVQVDSEYGKGTRMKIIFPEK